MAATRHQHRVSTQRPSLQSTPIFPLFQCQHWSPSPDAPAWPPRARRRSSVASPSPKPSARGCTSQSPQGRLPGLLVTKLRSWRWRQRSGEGRTRPVSATYTSPHHNGVIPSGHYHPIGTPSPHHNGVIPLGHYHPIGTPSSHRDTAVPSLRCRHDAATSLPKPRAVLLPNVLCWLLLSPVIRELVHFLTITKHYAADVPAVLPAVSTPCGVPRRRAHKSSVQTLPHRQAST